MAGDAVHAFKAGTNPLDPQNPGAPPFPTGMPADWAIAFNRNGGFFEEFDRVGGRHQPGLGGQVYTGGTRKAQAQIVLHELAHLVLAPKFVPDFGNDVAGRANNEQVHDNCSVLIGRIQ